jgi:tetratricopeptide (TPR) repeat protein
LQKARSAADNTALAGLHIWCLLQNNNLSAAQQLLNTAIAEFEVDQHIAYSGALIHEQSGNHELAHSLYSDLFAINNETTVLQACARTALASSQAQRCLDCLDQLLLATDVTPKHLTMRAAAFAQLHRYSESMALLVNMLEDWPNDGELLLQTAFVAYDYAVESSDLNLYVDAARLLRRITELDPQNALAFLSLARCASSLRRPIKRFTPKMVFSGFVTAWRFAGWPTRRSLSVKATIDGVVRAPSAFSITRGWLPSIIAIQEFVVPRSIPITLAIFQIPYIRQFERREPISAPAPVVTLNGSSAHLTV